MPTEVSSAIVKTAGGAGVEADVLGAAVPAFDELLPHAAPQSASATKVMRLSMSAESIQSCAFGHEGGFVQRMVRAFFAIS